MKNKKLLMTISAFMILIYHLWIYIFKENNVEIFIKQICFIGVDIFFFLSAYNIGKNKIDYKGLIKNRFQTIYLKYILFAIIACIFNNWNISRLIKVLLGIEFFEKGGGSFLWFIPAIMIMYLFLPIYKKFDDNHKIFTPCIFIVIFISISIYASTCLNYDALFIFTNRIPIILIGYYFAKYKLFDKLESNKFIYILLLVFLLFGGITLSYITFFNHINITFFKEIFYLNAIPLILSLVLLFNIFPTNKITNFLGNFTLEIYAVQMIFGFKLADFLYGVTTNKILTNILSIFIVIIISVIINKLIVIIGKTIKKLL